MARQSFIYDHVAGELVTAEEFVARKRKRTPRRRSDLAAPNPIGDFAEPLLCPADGVRYHSKRAYDRAVARKGLVDATGEHKAIAALRPQVPRKRAAPYIKQAIDELGKKAWL